MQRNKKQILSSNIYEVLTDDATLCFDNIEINEQPIVILDTNDLNMNFQKNSIKPGCNSDFKNLLINHSIITVSLQRRTCGNTNDKIELEETNGSYKLIITSCDSRKICSSGKSTTTQYVLLTQKMSSKNIMYETELL